MAQKMHKVKVLHTRTGQGGGKYFRAGVCLTTVEQDFVVTSAQLQKLEADRYVKVVSKTEASAKDDPGKPDATSEKPKVKAT